MAVGRANALHGSVPHNQNRDKFVWLAGLSVYSTCVLRTNDAACGSTSTANRHIFNQHEVSSQVASINSTYGFGALRRRTHRPLPMQNG